MSMQLDRKGLWNLLGPIICALLIMVAAWVSPVGLRGSESLNSKHVCHWWCSVLQMWDPIFRQVYRGVRRRHCYPPSWKRWVFYLLPGAVCALTGVCLYIFAGTEDNYYYTHSLWHILVATCVVFLLPPKEKNREALGWSRGWSWRPQVCGYTLCESSKDELCTVT